LLAVRGHESVQQQAERLRVTVLRSMEVLHSIAGLHASNGRIERGMFQRFVVPALERQPELLALSWNPIVSHESRGGFEQSVRGEGFGDFRLVERTRGGDLVPANVRTNYVPVHCIEPLDRNRAALGYDLGSEADRRRSLELAAELGTPVMTAPLQLAQGPWDRPGLLVMQAVFDTAAGKRGALAGYSVAVFRVDDLLSPLFEQLRRQGIDAGLFDGAVWGKPIFLGTLVRGRVDSEVSIDMAGGRWVLAYSIRPSYGASQLQITSWICLIGGVVSTLVTCGFLYNRWLRTVELDVTNARLRQEVEVRQEAEARADLANRAKSDFLASMSHEIRTPLNAILGYTQMLRRDPALAPEQRDAVEGVHLGGSHLLGLINEILDLSKIEAGKMELNVVDFELAGLVRGVASTFRSLCARKGIGFRLGMEMDSRCFARGDEGKLRQVLINLVGNAVKFTMSGEVCLEVGWVDGGGWQFAVIDTGLGIPEEEQADIFRPFHQGSAAGHLGGTGLGLAIAQRQVELMGGELRCRSSRGAGSRFHFTIPLAAAAGEVERWVRSTGRLSEGQCVKALVVDDEPANRDVMARMLRSIGCEVEVASDSRAALLGVRAGDVNVVFVDLLLAGESGLEVAKELAGEGAPSRPVVIAHSASTLPSLKEMALSAGCVGFLAKPVSIEMLAESLERFLGVRFEEVENLEMPAVSVEEHLSVVRLPEALCSRLMVAAELHSTTVLKSGLAELRQHGSEACRLADVIRQRMRGYDMDGIQRLLSRYTCIERGVGVEVAMDRKGRG